MIKGIKTIIPPAGEGIPSKKLSFHDGSSSEFTLNLASLKATQTTYVKQTNHPIYLDIVNSKNTL